MLTLITHLLLFTTFALADSGKGTASPPPPPPPTIEVRATPDFNGLGKTSHLRPKNADGKPHQAEARLISDHSTVKAGQTIQLGLLLNQDKGWHTYWKSPGDIGQPTTIEWNLAEGADAADYVYAVPQRFDYQGIISFGYDTQAVLLASVTLPTEITGDSITFEAKSNWLICEVMCIQGEVELALTLPVADSPIVGPWAPLVKHYQAQHPVTVKELENVTVEGSLSVAQIKHDSPFSATFTVSPKGDNITLGAPPKMGIWPTYTPIAGSEWMILDAHTKQNPDGSITIKVNAESFAPEQPPEGDEIGGLFQIDVNGEMVRFEHTIPMPWPGLDVATTPPTDKAPSAESSSIPEASSSVGTLLSMLMMAFFGGLLLNIMPCVLPVLTMKLYGLIEQSEISTKEKKVAGLSYTAGIIVSFVALAIAVIVVQTSVGAVGWGFQFQYPPYVAALATIVFAFGLSLFGVFELPALGANAANNAGAKEGPAGYFMTGVFATLVATPCSAPFLGTALGFAFSQPPVVITAFFALIGLGLAAPFLLIAFIPALYKLLPRPGAWMVTFKQLMGFTLIATTVWLIDVLASQVGSANATGFMAFLVFVSLGSWVFGTWGGLGETRKRQLTAGLIGIGIVVFGGRMFLNLEPAEADCGPVEISTDNLDFSHEIPWQPFSDEAVKSLAGRAIFIDFTADWCLTCKVNEKAILETKAVREAMEANGIIPLKADWTNRNDEIGDWLKRYGRAGVPFYLVLPADPSAKDLPLGEVITKESVIAALEKAAIR